MTDEMLEAADRRIYLPMFGFTESFNLSVAAALVLQRLLDAVPESRGRRPAMWETGRLRPRPAGSPEAAFSAGCSELTRLLRAAPSFGHPRPINRFAFSRAGRP